ARRHAEGLRCDVLVPAVAPPTAAIICAGLVLLAVEKAGGHEIFETVGAGPGRLEREVIERTRVGVSGLARQAVIDRVVDQPFVGSQLGGGRTRLILCSPAETDLQAAVVDRVVAGKHILESVTEREAVESRRGG